MLIMKGTKASWRASKAMASVDFVFLPWYGSLSEHTGYLWSFQIHFRLYRKVFDKAYGAASGDKMLHDLEDALKDYNSAQGEECERLLKSVENWWLLCVHR